MLFGLLVSKKKYDELQKEATEAQNDLEETCQVLDVTRADLDRQVAINQELRQFSENFKKFYESVTKIPVVTKSTGPAMTLKGSILLDEREIAYGDVIGHLKSELIYDLARRLEAEGCVKFDLEQDRSTGRTAYVATINVFKGGT